MTPVSSCAYKYDEGNEESLALPLNNKQRNVHNIVAG